MYLNLKKERRKQWWSDEIFSICATCIYQLHISTQCAAFYTALSYVDSFLILSATFGYIADIIYIYEIKGLANYLFTMLTSFHFPPRFFNFKKNYPIKSFYSNKDKYHVCCIWNWTLFCDERFVFSCCSSLLWLESSCGYLIWYVWCYSSVTGTDVYSFWFPC